MLPQAEQLVRFLPDHLLWQKYYRTSQTLADFFLQCFFLPVVVVFNGMVVKFKVEYNIVEVNMLILVTPTKN